MKDCDIRDIFIFKGDKFSLRQYLRNEIEKKKKYRASLMRQ